VTAHFVTDECTIVDGLGTLGVAALRTAAKFDVEALIA
jgi:hypothetical protein